MSGSSGGSPPSSWYTTLTGRCVLIVAALAISVGMVVGAYTVKGTIASANASQCLVRLQKAVPVETNDPGNSDLRVAAAAYRIFPDQSPPLIKRVGGILGEVGQGRHLWLVSKSLKNSFDSASPQNAGTERYFALGELFPDEQGCWSAEANTGYDAALGLVFQDAIVDVDDQTSALFRAPGPPALQDGFDPHILQAQNATIVATYDIRTK